MKTRKLLFVPVAALIALASCKKENSASEEIETTFTLSENQAVSDYLAEDANNLFFEVSAQEGLVGGRTSQTVSSLQNLTCASVSVTGGAFPKTIVIDFGTGCTANGVTRSGKVNIVLSDSVSNTGSTATMTFTNYHVQNFKVEGSIIWTNTTTTSLSWSREIDNGKVTAPNGYYWLHEGTKNVVQSGGATTPFNLLDDVYSVTGSHTVTNPQGVSRSATVLEALEKKVICSNLTKGKMKLQGPNHYAVIDYGDGTCDRVASISIDGHAPRNFLLP